MFGKKPVIRIEKGRFAGEILYYDKSFGLYHILKHPLDSYNVKAFKVKEVYPFYCGKLGANLYCVTWRDNTESYFTGSAEPGTDIEKTIKKDYQSKLIEWHKNYKKTHNENK